MNTYTTRTAELGKITFHAPAATDTQSGFVWVETEHAPDRRQICYGGDFTGNTMRATTQSLKADAQAWLRQRRAWMRKEGLV